jgi:hypothetical protein
MRRSWTAFAVVTVAACLGAPEGVPQNPAVKSARIPKEGFDDKIQEYSHQMFTFGRKVFRYDSFGSEDFFGGVLGLHQAIKGSENGGVGRGLTPVKALELGIKVDAKRLPKALGEVLLEGDVALQDPDTTLDLIRADAVVGVKGVFEGEDLVSVGITCALCHATVDDSVMKGIGRRLDGWPNRDLDVGKIVAMAPNLAEYARMLGKDKEELEKILLAWGPGKYDAELNQDGVGFRPDGKSAATVLPAAFGLAGVNLGTYTGWGSVTYWNAYVATTQMQGHGTFFEPRIDGDRFPVGKRLGLGNKRVKSPKQDRVTDRLPALHYYQLSIPAPSPPKGSYDESAARRGKALFNGEAGCARCHVPPLFTEPGWSMHKPAEIGIDDFQAKRSPEGMYRTTPLRGLFVRAKGGFYHDGRFRDLGAVVDHYAKVLGFSLSPNQKKDLVEYLKSL